MRIAVVGTGISRLDFEPERFDRVVSVEMFEHMNNHELLVKRITKWMRPGGRLFVRGERAGRDRAPDRLPGEGWHNNHHRYPSSERQGFYWWEVDVTHYGLEKVGLVRDLRAPPAKAYRKEGGAPS